MPELADIFLLHGAEYIKHFGDKLLPSHRKAMGDIISCRTKDMGGHVCKCSHCAKKTYSYHSCKNRSCPKCGGKDTSKWLEEREKQLPDTHYFHIVLTLPQELRDIVRSNQKLMYKTLFSCSARALKDVADYNGFHNGELAFLSVLHTWTRTMMFHPHVHLLIAGGCLDKERNIWISAKPTFMMPAPALSKVFRAIFMKKAKKVLPIQIFPKSVWDKDWVVDIKPVISHRREVITYLARYVKRIAITNNRILSVKDGKVTFKYQDSKTRVWKFKTLEVNEFISRFLQHILPRNFTKIRYYGLFSPGKKKLLHIVKLLLNKNEDTSKNEKSEEEKREVELPVCPHCKKGVLVVIEEIKPSKRDPPW